MTKFECRGRVPKRVSEQRLSFLDRPRPALLGLRSLLKTSPSATQAPHKRERGLFSNLD